MPPPLPTLTGLHRIYHLYLLPLALVLSAFYPVLLRLLAHIFIVLLYAFYLLPPLLTILAAVYLVTLAISTVIDVNTELFYSHLSDRKGGGAYASRGIGTRRDGHREYGYGGYGNGFEPGQRVYLEREWDPQGYRRHVEANRGRNPLVLTNRVFIIIYIIRYAHLRTHLLLAWILNDLILLPLLLLTRLVLFPFKAILAVWRGLSGLLGLLKTGALCGELKLGRRYLRAARRVERGVGRLWGVRWLGRGAGWAWVWIVARGCPYMRMEGEVDGADGWSGVVARWWVGKWEELERREMMGYDEAAEDEEEEDEEDEDEDELELEEKQQREQQVQIEMEMEMQRRVPQWTPEYRRYKDQTRSLEFSYRGGKRWSRAAGREARHGWSETSWGY